MKRIECQQTFVEFRNEKDAVLFFDASWSQYSEISKRMVEFVEGYSKMGGHPFVFYSGAFEGSLVEFAEKVTADGISHTAFAGYGSVAVYSDGDVVGFMESVIGSGIRRLMEMTGQRITTEERSKRAEQGGASNTDR